MDDSNHASPETIRQREDALYAAMIALDYAALDDLLSSDLSYVHSTGVVESKAAYLAALRQGLYEYARSPGTTAARRSSPPARSRAASSTWR